MLKSHVFPVPSWGRQEAVCVKPWVPQYVPAAARERDIWAAARSLHLTQPALSRRRREPGPQTYRIYVRAKGRDLFAAGPPLKWRCASNGLDPGGLCLVGKIIYIIRKDLHAVLHPLEGVPAL